jgi:hypothetical protein
VICQNVWARAIRDLRRLNFDELAELVASERLSDMKIQG